MIHTEIWGSDIITEVGYGLDKMRMELRDDVIGWRKWCHSRVIWSDRRGNALKSRKPDTQNKPKNLHGAGTGFWRKKNSKDLNHPGDLKFSSVTRTWNHLDSDLISGGTAFFTYYFFYLRPVLSTDIFQTDCFVSKHLNDVKLFFFFKCLRPWRIAVVCGEVCFLNDLSGSGHRWHLSSDP